VCPQLDSRIRISTSSARDEIENTFSERSANNQHSLDHQDQQQHSRGGSGRGSRGRGEAVGGKSLLGTRLFQRENGVCAVFGAVCSAAIYALALYRRQRIPQWTWLGVVFKCLSCLSRVVRKTFYVDRFYVDSTNTVTTCYSARNRWLGTVPWRSKHDRIADRPRNTERTDPKKKLGAN